MFYTNSLNTYTTNTLNQSPNLYHFELCKNISSNIPLSANKNRWCVLLNPFFETVKKYVQTKFIINTFSFNYGIRRRWNSVFRQYMDQNIDLLDVFKTTTKLIDDSHIRISNTIDIIRIYEFVIKYVTNVLINVNNEDLDEIPLSDDSIFLTPQKLGKSIIKSFSFLNLKQSFHNLITEYNNISTKSVYLFTDCFAAVYHYYKHKKFGNNILTFFEYLKQAKYFVDIVVNNYTEKQMRNINACNMTYIIEYGAHYISYYRSIRKNGISCTVYISEINPDRVNTRIKLVFLKKGNYITIKTFYVY